MERARPVIVALLSTATATAMALTSAPALGHDERFPKQERLRIELGGVFLVIDHAVPPGDVAQTLRRIFDRDRSGRLDPAEQAALGRHLETEALAFLAVTVDGQALRPRVTTRDYAVGADTAGERIAIRVELVAETTLGAGDHELRLADRHKDRRVAVPLEIALGPGLSWRRRPPPRPLLVGEPLLLEVRR